MNIATPKSAQAQSSSIIMVVEDDVLIRLCVAEYLRECGYSVLEATSGDEALGILGSLTVDAVFSDVRMPGSTDGAALVHWIRRHHPCTVSILTSAYFPKGPAWNELEDVPFVPKPYEPGYIVSVVRSELAKRRLDDVRGPSPDRRDDPELLRQN
jgi:CheY-like chemotaxis protein